MPEAVGVVEWRSIAIAIEATDAMLDAAEVEVLVSTPVCSGKYVTIVSGDVASVQVAVETGVREGGNSLVEAVVIPNVHPDIQPAITATTGVENVRSLGVIEVFSVAGAVYAADASVKSADVRLIEIRCARGLGGKAFVTLTGDVDAVRTATETGAAIAREKGLLAASVVIPDLNEKLRRFVL
ncbi:MAG TPA: BMC domain-containing protein [bacterium]|nr:BMC domain-containing protein [bacterium]